MVKKIFIAFTSVVIGAVCLAFDMSSRRNKEEEYNEDEDDDFVPDGMWKMQCLRTSTTANLR